MKIKDFFFILASMKLFKLICFFVLIIFLSCDDKSTLNRDNDALNDSIKETYIKLENAKSDALRVFLSDKLDYLNSKITNDSIRFNNYDSIIKKTYSLNLLKQNRFIINKALNEYETKKDTIRKLNAYKNLGNYFLKTNKVDSAFIFFDKIEKYYISKNDFVKANEITLKKSLIKYKEGDFLGCETSLFKSLPITKKENNSTLLNVSYTLLGLCKIELKEYDEAFYFLSLAIKNAKDIDADKLSVEIAYNNIGYSFLNKRDYKKALEYYNKIELSDNLKNNNYQVFLYTKQNIAYSKFKLGLNQNFEKEYEAVIEGYNELNLSPIQPLVQLSEFYETQDNIKKAQELALNAYQISIKQKTYRDKLIALKQLTNVFPEKAKDYSNEYIKLSDSIAAIDKKTQNTFARIEYRVDELNNENLLLAERNQRLIYYFVIGVLLLSMFYFYRWQKQKQREFILVQEQQKANEEVYSLMINQQTQMDYVKAQEQKRISQELHDGVLGKLFGARMNLDYLNSQESEQVKKDKEKYIHEIIQVEKQIRQISHELNDDKQSIINNYQLMIDRLVQEQEKFLNLQIDYVVNTKVPWEKLSAEEKINLYRIFQETFHNIIKYANAKKVTFSIVYSNNNLKISILDDGNGFDVQKTHKGIGIKNMRDRAKLINATLSINSEINKGTTTQIILEINPNKEF
ncbi:ATP-binding protein [uncultured Flavobacterium sp.]|uniref:tetratricopeptide repeat-containing sensor histidine kinase n=1 Tax=uncultured Flavobacterium sp. TaxID=165435 RepID=UPI0030EEFA81|tara:strand:- start:44258 stop:46318 length:2061 start_codon:yes stop_codon:yes gene_type:complete